MSDELASISASAKNIEDAILYGTMDNFDGYDYAYLNIQDGSLDMIASVPGESASTYADFSDDYFDELTGEAEILINTDTFLFYLETSGSGDDPVTINFHGEEDSQLASSVEIIGSLNSRVYLPSSQQILEQIPLWLESSFTESGNYKPGDKELETKIETTADQIQKIIDIVDAEEVRGIDEYPLVVQDGELVLHAVDENSRNEVSGSLQSSVEGPDLSVTYQTGFSEAFDSLWGDITLRSSPGGAPLAITKGIDEGTIRHVIGHTGTIG